jgi:hypothetical protein
MQIIFGIIPIFCFLLPQVIGDLGYLRDFKSLESCKAWCAARKSVLNNSLGG